MAERVMPINYVVTLNEPAPPTHIPIVCRLTFVVCGIGQLQLDVERVGRREMAEIVQRPSHCGIWAINRDK